MVSSPHPAKSRRRYVIAGAVILLMLTALIVVRCAVSGDSTSAAPQSYGMTSVWDIKNVGMPIAYRADSGTIFLWQRKDETKALSPRDIVAIDFGTGKRKWVGSPEGWEVSIEYIPGNKLTAQAIIVHRKNPGAIAALRLTDGKVLWKMNFPGDFGRPTAVTKNVVVVAWDTRTFRGLSADDGAKLWEVAVPDGCEADELGGDSDLVVAEVVCAKKRYLESFDPASGKSLWQHSVPFGDSFTKGNLRVRGNAALLQDSDHLLMLSKSGAVALDVTSRGLGELRFTANADVAAVGYVEETEAETLTAIDLGQAKVLWSKPVRVGSLSMAGGKLYSLAPLPAPLVPAVLYEIELSTGQMAVSPAHLTRTNYDSIVAIDGKTLVTYYYVHGKPTSTSHVQSHWLEPLPGTVGFAGGAPGAGWPDSCALLHPEEIGTGYQAQPEKVTVADAVLPAGSCQFQPASVTSPVVTAGIAWTGTDVEQAKQMMSQIRQFNEVIPLAGIGDESLRIEVYGDPKYRTDVYFRVGSRIGKVSISGDSALALKLAKVAVTRLG